MIKVCSVLAVLFLVAINLFAEINVHSQMQSHQEIKHEIVYDAQGLPVGVNIWAYSLQVPIVDGMVWWPDAAGYALHTYFDLNGESSQQAKSVSQNSGQAESKQSDPPKMESKSFQIQRPNIEFVPPQAPESVQIIHGSQAPHVAGCYARVHINTASKFAGRFASMSNKEFANYWLAGIAYQKYSRMKYHMTSEQKDKLMSACRYKNFTQQLLADDTLADEVVLELWQEFCDLKSWPFGDDRRECDREIKSVLKWRQENRSKLAQQCLENICKARAEQIQVEINVENRELEQAQELTRAHQKLGEDKRRFFEAAYELPESYLQDEASPNREFLRKQALEQTKIDGFVQHKADYDLTPQAQAYLKIHDFDPADYRHFFGTSLQQQFHGEVISIFEKAARLSFELPYRSNFVQNSLFLADAAYEENKLEQIQMIVALNNLSFQLLDTVEVYSLAALRGVVHGSIAGMQALCHPLGSIESLAQSLYYVFETAALTDCAQEFGFEDLYVDLCDQRNAEIAAALSALGQKILSSSGPEIVEELVSFGASFYVPGKILSAFGGVLGVLQSAIEVVPAVEGALVVAGESGQAGKFSSEVIQGAVKLEQAIAEQVAQEAAQQMFRTTKKLKHPKKLARDVIEGRTGKPTEPRTLQKKMDDALRDAKRRADKERPLLDGRIRYYEKERLSDTLGPTRGRSYVTEHDPKANRVRQWTECYDHFGNVNRVRPKMINGREVFSQHYPATYKDNLNNIKGAIWRTRENNVD